MVLVIMVVAGLHKPTPSPARVLQQAAEESVAVLSWHQCRARLPELRFRRQELVYRAPGRYQVIRRRAKDQISCVTWQGQIQFVDTALMQPGNGVIHR